MLSKRRNAAFELLRVIAMLMIIGHHLSYYSGLMNIEPGMQRHFARFINVGGKLGVNVFVMIGAWFMSAKAYRAEHTARIWLQTLSTGCLCAAVYGLFLGGSNMQSAVLQALFPVGQSGYWFAAHYIVLTLMSPFLNLLLRETSGRAMDALLVVLTLVLSAIPTVFIGKTTFFSPIFWFVYLYLLTGRLRMRPIRLPGRLWSGLFWAGVVFVCGSTVLFEHLKEKIPLLENQVNYFGNRMETLPVLVSSVGLFMSFAVRKPFESRLIERAGAACFGVYLLHDSPLLRGWLWNDVVRAGALAQSPWLIPYALAAIPAVFVCAMAAEIFRAKLFGAAERRALRAVREPLRRFDRLMNENLIRPANRNDGEA